MVFLLKYASRSRPELFRKRVENWRSMASGRHQLRWLCSCDADDPTMNNDAIRAFCAERGITLSFGRNPGKVAAINADMELAEPWAWETLVLISDDMACIREGWDETIAQEMRKWFPEGNGAVWFPDGVQLRLCTFSVFGRGVWERHGFIYHPDFKSLYCDNYYQELMVRGNCLRFVDLPLVRHEWGADNQDDLMKRNERKDIYAEDWRTYKRLTTVGGHERSPGISGSEPPAGILGRVCTHLRTAAGRMVRVVRRGG